MSAVASPSALLTAKRLRVGLLLLVGVGLLAAQQTGLLRLFTEPARTKQLLLELGPWGYLAFILAYAVLQPFGVPGTVFILVAPLIWPWPIAFALSMAGTMAASVVGFSFARFVARDWVSERIPARFRAYNDALEKRGFTTVVTLRFLFWMPPLLHAFFGISRVPFWTHFWGSAVGYILPLLATAYFGERFFEWMRTAPPWVWGVVVLVIATAIFTAWRFRRSQPGPPASRADGPG